MITAVSSIDFKGFQGSKKDVLPHATNLKAQQADTFQKQEKLKAVCALTDGFATPAMV